MNTSKIKNIDFEVKVSLQESGGGGFNWEGYVAAFGNVDSYGDVIAEGAFSEQLGNTIPAFYEHDIPVGKMFLLGEDSYGLKVRGELAPDTAQDPRVGNLSQRIRWLMASNDNVGELSYKMSIGYYVLESHDETRDGESVRVLTKLKLVEGSLVMNPANEKAVITVFKSEPETLTAERLEAMTERELEAALKSGVAMSGTVSKTVVSLLKQSKPKDLERLAKLFSH